MQLLSRSHIIFLIKKNYFYIIGLIFTFIASALLMLLYEKNTHWIYYWDNAAYWDQVNNLSISLRKSLAEFLITLKSQIHTEYPTWWAIPFAMIPPSYLINRSGFTIPLAVVSTCGIFVASNLIFRKYNIEKKASVILSICLIMSPPVWIILSESEPDLLSIFFLLIGFYVALKANGDLGINALSALMFTIAIAFRKTEAFAALFGIIYLLINFTHDAIYKKITFKYKKIFLMSIFTIILVVYASPGIILSLFRNNAEFYKSWKINPGEVISRFTYVNGFAIILSSTLFIFYFFYKTQHNLIKNSWIILLPAGVLFAFLTIAPAEAPVHMAQLGFYLLLASFTVISIFQHKIQVKAAFSILLACFFLTAQSIFPILGSGNSALSMNIQPLTRPDISQLYKIKNILSNAKQEISFPDIYVAGSSGVINPDLITRITRPNLHVVPAGDVDFRDAIQWPLIMNSNFIVIPEPFQWHISNSSHNIVKVPMKVLLKNKHKLEKLGSVTLDKKVKVSIYNFKTKFTQEELRSAQELLVSVLPTYSIPTVLDTKLPYFQPTPGGPKRIWFRVGTKINPSIIWVPKDTQIILNPLDMSCLKITGIPIPSDKVGSKIVIPALHKSTTLKIFRLNSNNNSCDYEILWR